ncbi:F-box/kelch-repeat protein At3g23880-like [Solanum tuberosum]|uniref:F-box/kelch-repeat protein At3g23880-like n=1 Tax=Solanum tuberosum TaxID=4113 RepID=UPI00073A20B0|nr:PREDICTED: F-box/kelch-repeat protein At3g23880-like [Solanum tuberosum]
MLMLGFDLPENNLKDCSVSSLLSDHVTTTIDLDYPPKESHQSTKIVGSVNGLICVAIEKKDLFLWNPSIRKLKKLPDSETSYVFSYDFEYDELHDDYKPGMFVNGKLHWAITTKRFSNNNYWDIIFVDLANGKWGDIEKPMGGEGNFVFISCLSVLGNDLSMVSSQLISHLDLWVMKEYGVK